MGEAPSYWQAQGPVVRTFVASLAGSFALRAVSIFGRLADGVWLCGVALPRDSHSAASLRRPGMLFLPDREATSVVHRRPNPDHDLRNLY